MAWTRLQPEFRDHPKVVAAGVEAKGLFIDLICYATEYLTDGKISQDVALRLALSNLSATKAPIELIDKLVWCRLLEETAEDGYQIHDYTDYNFTKAEAEALSEVRSDSGKKGAKKRWHPDAPMANPMASAMDSDPSLSSGMASAMANGWQTDGSDSASASDSASQGTRSVQQGEGNQGHAGEDEQEPEVSGEWG